MATQHFAYGTRFHGNVAALLGGTPAHLLAHDSRTLELAEYHRMPYTMMPSFDADVSAAELYAATDMSEFNAELPRGFDRFTAFLDRNGLQHVHTPGNGRGDFDERLAAATFPKPVHPIIASDGHEIASRLQWLRDGMVLDITRHPQAYEQPWAHPAWTGAGSRHERLHEKVRAQAGEIETINARLEMIERGSPYISARRIGSWFKRLLRRS